MRILCVGIAVQDRIFTVDNLPSQEGKYFAKALSEQGGGPAATAAVACARLRTPTDMIARVGDDATGKAIIAELQAEHVGIELMRVIKGASSTQASITVDSAGSRVIVSYPSPSLIPDADFMDNIDFSKYDMVLADVRWHEGAKKAFLMAKEAGIPTLLDADTTPQNIEDLIALSTHAVFSKPGLAKTTGTDDYQQGLKLASKLTAGSVYVTLGSEGYARIQDNEVITTASFKVKAVDTTGAGDVFHGALACAFINKLPVDQALRFAAAVSALKCTKAGGRSGIPSLTEVQEFLKQN